MKKCLDQLGLSGSEEAPDVDEDVGVKHKLLPFWDDIAASETLEESLKWLLRKKDPPKIQRPSKAKVTSLCVVRKFIERFEKLGF